MGGTVCTLVGMYLSSGCRASVVASALAFHPPDPFYDLVYNPATKQYSVVFADVLPEMEHGRLEVTMLRTRTGGRVPVFFLASPGATETILFSHGNASDCGAMYMLYMLLATSLGVNVVAYDYTGYGASRPYRKRPTEHQTYIDIMAVYSWCIERKIVDNPARQLIVYGQSVGSGPSTWLAMKKPVAGLVLHSPILSGLRVITTSRFLACFDIFPNISRIGHVNCPVFVIHGEEDMEVPFNHGLELQQAVIPKYQYSPWWVPLRGHNDVLYNNEVEFINRMKHFLEYLRRGSHLASLKDVRDVEEKRTLLSTSSQPVVPIA